MGYTLIGFYLGAILGSFVKVLADRSVNKKSFWGRSYCLSCKHKLQWYDLFPIISYLVLAGKCRYCKKGISLEYLLVELAMGFLIGLLFFQSLKDFSLFGFIFAAKVKFDIFTTFKPLLFLFNLIFQIFLITILVVLFLTDLKKMLIPDRISLPAIEISLIYQVFITAFKIFYLFYFLNQSTVGKLLLPPHSPYFQRHAIMLSQDLIGGLLSGLLIAGFFILLIIISKGKGMGGGDVKLGALMGIALGFPLSLVALMIAILTGAVISIFLVIFGKKNFGQTVPFGPFLVLGSLVVIFWGSEILNWYLNLQI